MGLKRLGPSELTVFLSIALVSSLIALFAYHWKPRFLVYVDLKAVDALSYAAPLRNPPNEIAIVAVDEKSVNELGRWPWTRKTTAELIARLESAKTVALDIVFSEPEDKESDGALAKAVEESGNVVLGYFLRGDTDTQPPKKELSQIRRSRISLVRSIGPVEGAAKVRAPEFRSAETNIAPIAEWAAGTGTFNIIPDIDGIHRAVNLVYLYKGELYPNLALEALRDYLSSSVMLDAAEYGIDSIRMDGRTLPVNEAGSLMLSFYGPGGSFHTYSAVDVIRGRTGEGVFKDKLVFVGVTEKGIYDIRPTPVDAYFPGVELLATAAGNALEGRFLVRDSRVIMMDYAMVFVLPVVLALLIARARRTLLALFVFGALMALSIIMDFYLYSYAGLRVSPVYPSLALALSYLGGEAYRNIVVEKKSRYLRKAFSTYVSSQLVNEILKDPEKLKLGGEKRLVTVLFSDIRGFTSLSERLTPEGLVALLNEYLSPMTRIVLEEEGMLDKYIGDAIMAVFNAPVEIPDHPARACRTAIEMMEKLEELNSLWSARGWPRIDIGIGINTGEAVVGNMGAELRFDYTAIGDTVNLASRLEGINKLYGTNIIVSEQTWVHVKDGFSFREIDLVRVKGKESPSAIYELIGEKGEGIEGLAGTFSRALSLYRTRRFEEARSVFGEVLERFPGDGPSAVYIERCAEYLASPPPPDWDGVFVAKTK